jgi:hypothetical protein
MSRGVWGPYPVQISSANADDPAVVAMNSDNAIARRVIAETPFHKLQQPR